MISHNAKLRVEDGELPGDDTSKIRIGIIVIATVIPLLVRRPPSAAGGTPSREPVGPPQMMQVLALTYFLPLLADASEAWRADRHLCGALDDQFHETCHHETCSG